MSRLLRRPTAETPAATCPEDGGPSSSIEQFAAPPARVEDQRLADGGEPALERGVTFVDEPREGLALAEREHGPVLAQRERNRGRGDLEHLN